jgi:hypothetical protein
MEFCYVIPITCNTSVKQRELDSIGTGIQLLTLLNFFDTVMTTTHQ